MKPGTGLTRRKASSSTSRAVIMDQVSSAPSLPISRYGACARSGSSAPSTRPAGCPWCVRWSLLGGALHPAIEGRCSPFGPVGAEAALGLSWAGAGPWRLLVRPAAVRWYRSGRWPGRRCGCPCGQIQPRRLRWPCPLTKRISEGSAINARTLRDSPTMAFTLSSAEAKASEAVSLKAIS